MDYTSKELSNTLSKIYYPYITLGLYNWLGIIILYKLEVKKPGPIEKYVHYFQPSIEHLGHQMATPGKQMRDIETAQKEVPPVVFEFLKIMEKKGLKSRFGKVFTSLDFQESDALLSILDPNQLAFSLGSQYFQTNKDFSRTNFTLMKDIFFSHMLNEYFQATAIGSIKTLQYEWYNKRTSINAFQAIMIKQYNKYLAKQPVEARIVLPLKPRKRF